MALKSIGAPILGDTLYGGETSDRLYLHAWHLPTLSSGELSVTAPDTGEVINEADAQTWYNGLNAPETYPWFPARTLFAGVLGENANGLIGANLIGANSHKKIEATLNV